MIVEDGRGEFEHPAHRPIDVPYAIFVSVRLRRGDACIPDAAEIGEIVWVHRDLPAIAERTLGRTPGQCPPLLAAVGHGAIELEARDDSRQRCRERFELGELATHGPLGVRLIGDVMRRSDHRGLLPLGREREYGMLLERALDPARRMPHAEGMTKLSSLRTGLEYIPRRRDGLKVIRVNHRLPPLEGRLARRLAGQLSPLIVREEQRPINRVAPDGARNRACKCFQLSCAS